MLQMLNREINVLKHMRYSKYTHPVDLYQELLRICRRTVDLLAGPAGA